METKKLKMAVGAYLMMVLCGMYLVLSSGDLSSARAANLYGGAISGGCHECDTLTTCDTDETDPTSYCRDFINQSQCVSAKYRTNEQGRSRKTCKKKDPPGKNQCDISNEKLCVKLYKCWWSIQTGACNANTGPYHESSLNIDCAD